MMTLRADIAYKVRELRKARGLNQAQLAQRLGLSQSRLSELERGGGSFTAEQLIVMSRLFNVPPAAFVKSEAHDETAELQNALASYGATHLVEHGETAPSDDLTVTQAIREALASGVPRLITALGPVLVRHIDRVSLGKLRIALGEVGLARRLGWLEENVLAAIDLHLASSPPRDVIKRCRRAQVVLEADLDTLASQPADSAPPDLLDPSIRSTKTRKDLERTRSPISARWNIVTALQPDDFLRALAAADVGD